MTAQDFLQNEFPLLTIKLDDAGIFDRVLMALTMFSDLNNPVTKQEIDFDEPFYWSTSSDISEKISRIKCAVQSVTGITFQAYTQRSRKREYVFARMLFAERCLSIGMTTVAIGYMLNLDHSTIVSIKKKFQNEVDTSKYFKDMAERVKFLQNPK